MQYVAYFRGHGKSAVLYEAVVESDVLPWDNNNRLEYNYCVELDGNYEWEKLQKGERRARQTDKRVVERPQQEPRHRGNGVTFFCSFCMFCL